MRHSIRSRSLLFALSLWASPGCYAAHEPPIEVEELGDGDRSPALAECRPRFDAPIEVYAGATTDERALHLTWTGSAFLVAFSAEEGVQWGARVGIDGHTRPLTAIPSPVTGLAPLPGTPYVAAGSWSGLWLLDRNGAVVDGPRLAGPDGRDWQLSMTPVARPDGLCVLAGVRGYLDTAEPSPEGLFSFTTMTPDALPEHMPLSRFAEGGSAWVIDAVAGPDGYGSFAVASAGNRLVAIAFADDGTPRLEASWPFDHALHGAVSTGAGDFAVFLEGAYGEPGQLAWLDLRRGTWAPLAPVGRHSLAWTATVAMGERALVAAPFGEGDDAPLAVRSYLAGTTSHDAELVIDAAPGSREVRLARHPCGFASAWRRADGSVRFQAYDCCP